MNERDWFQVAAYVGLLMVCTPLPGRFMAKVFAGERTLLTRRPAPVGREVESFAGCGPAARMRWEGERL